MSMHAAKCESDFVLLGLQDGEEFLTPVRIAATLATITVASAWVSSRKIRRLSLFFAHWLSAVVLGVGLVVDDMMISICWLSGKAEGFLMAIKYLELTASNMLAVTNLAISVNLALIVLSHRTMSRVKSVSSPRLVMIFLAISMVIAAASVPFWDVIIVLGTSVWITSFLPKRYVFLQGCLYGTQFIVGICMFFIVSWLLVFRMKEVKECWNLHRRIRYYFGLTIIGTAVNLGLGICGALTLFLPGATALLTIWSWLFRYIHITLDIFVLYGVLREKSKDVDERADGARTGGAGSSGQPVSRSAVCSGSAASAVANEPHDVVASSA